MSDENPAEALWAAHAADPSRDTVGALFAHYRALADYLAKRALSKAPPYQDREDIFSYAYHGLLNALERFEPDRGFKFEAYATRRIAGAIIDGQRRQDPLTRPARKRVKEMQAVETRLETELQRKPTVVEIANALGTDETEVRELLVTRQSLNASIEALVESEGVGGALSAAHLVSEVEDSLQLRELGERVTSLLNGLTRTEQQFIFHYYGEHRAVKDVAALLGTSRGEVHRIRDNVLQRLNGAPVAGGATASTTNGKKTMARKEIVVCDWKDKKGQCGDAADRLFTGHLDEEKLSADLCGAHFDELTKILASHGIRIALRTSGRRQLGHVAKSGRAFSVEDARIWLLDQGYDVKPTGRLANHYVQLYAEKH